MPSRRKGFDPAYLSVMTLEDASECFKKELMLEAKYYAERANANVLKHTDNEYSKQNFELAVKKIEELLPKITPDNVVVLSDMWTAYSLIHNAEHLLREETAKASKTSVVTGGYGKKIHEEARLIFEEYARRFPDISVDELATEAYEKIRAHNYDFLNGLEQKAPTKGTVKNWAKKTKGPF